MARSRGEFELNSNHWAIAPGRTVEGNAIFSGNPHVGFEDTTIEMHLVGPETDVYGISLGLFAFSGANPRVAWSETTNFTDAADIYRIEIDAGDHDLYLYDGERRRFEKHEEIFLVRQPDGSLSKVTRTLRWSHHGPVVVFDDEAGIALAVRATQADQVALYTQYREQMRARTVAEFQHALRYQARSTVNLTCADVDGNIGYVWLGRAARRPPGYDFTRPVPGNTSRTEWGPFYEFAALPQVINPEAGFVQNCNNSAWLVTPSGEIGRDFPPEMVPPTIASSRSGRPRRALEILEEPGRRFSVEDVKRMALDVKVVNGPETVYYLQTVLPRQVKDDPEIAAALRLFEEWSGYATPDNRALYLLTTFCWRWSELTEGTDRVERALREAIGFAKQHHGRIDQRGPVGSLISLHHGEPLRNRPDERGRFPMEKGSSHIMVAQMTEPPRLWSAKPFGNSADPSSRHYADLTELFAAGELKPVWIENDDILAHAESVLGRGVELPLPGGVGSATAATDSLVELAAVAEDRDGTRIRIEEVMGRRCAAEIRLAGFSRYRLSGGSGEVVAGWTPVSESGKPIRVETPAILEIERTIR
jgi:acyl-homoserine-lactone acylase